MAVSGKKMGGGGGRSQAVGGRSGWFSFVVALGEWNVASRVRVS